MDEKSWFLELHGEKVLGFEGFLKNADKMISGFEIQG